MIRWQGEVEQLGVTESSSTSLMRRARPRARQTTAWTTRGGHKKTVDGLRAIAAK